MRHGDDATAARAAAAVAIVGDVVIVVAREQAERLVDLAGVRARAVVARPQLERADGHERGVARVALVVRVEDGDELGELVLVSGRDVEGSGWGGGEGGGRASAVLSTVHSVSGQGIATIIHHGPPHVSYRYDTLLLALHGLREERERLLDLGLLLGGDVVLLGEARLPRLWGTRAARCARLGRAPGFPFCGLSHGQKERPTEVMPAKFIVFFSLGKKYKKGALTNHLPW